MGDILPTSTFCIHPVYNSKQNNYDNGFRLSVACCVPGTVASLFCASTVLGERWLLTNFTGKEIEVQEVKEFAPSQAASWWQIST